MPSAEPIPVLERLSMQVMRRWLDARTVGRHLYILDEVDSTNSALAGLAREGAEDGTVGAGRGAAPGPRTARAAVVLPAGVNLYASVLFRAPDRGRTR